MSVEHAAQRRIIIKLIHNPSLGFNELWGREGESNSFAYHVNKLEEQGLIERADGRYRLSKEGRKLSAFLEGEDGAPADFPTMAVLLVVQRGDLFLCQRRLKEPFYGYWSFVSGKINFGQNLFACATRDLREETGLIADDWEFKGIEMVKTFEGDDLLFHHYLFVVKTSSASGELVRSTQKAEHEWLTLDEFHAREGFPGHWCSQHIAQADHPVIVEGERYMKDGKFIGAKTVDVRKY